MIEVPYIYKMIQVFPPEEDQYISKCALEGRIWDAWMIPWAAQASKMGGAIVDVGANIGLDAVLFSCFAPVWAFEPVHHEILKHNVTGTLYPVAVEPYALSNHTGTSTVYLWDGPNKGACSLNSEIGQKSVQVELKRMDDVITGAVSFIKIDVEGHEMEVLEGARQIIERYKPVMCVETFEHLEDLKKFADEIGYIIQEAPEHNYILIFSKHLAQEHTS